MRQPTLNGKSFLQILSVILLVNFLCGALPAMAQAKRGATTRKPVNVAAKKPTEQAEEKIDLTGLIPPDKGKTMSAAYQSGVLPAPLALPAGTVKEQAFLLAEAVNRGDENSTAALIRALKAAGYGIRDAEGNIDYQHGWQGMALDGWQVAAMARSYGNGVGIGLGTFGDGLEIIAPEWKKETNVADLVNGIRNATRSEHSALRFWANFIIELGRRADAPYNLLDDEEVKHARLDVVQMSLIMTRLAADLNLAERRIQQSQRAEVEPNEFDQRNESNRKDGAAAYFVNASYRTNDQSQNIDVQTRDAVFNNASYKPQTNAADDPKPPCTTNELESLILDVNATGMGFGFGQFADYLESKGAMPPKTGARLDKANAVLTVLKLIATFAALDSEIKMDGEQMLTRTKTTQPGESKTLTAKVKIDVGKWQAMNCVRPALNAAGLDFSLPNDGALAGTRVDWNLVEGGAADSATGNFWYTVKNIPKVVMDGTMEQGDAIVFLDTRAGVAQPDKKYYKYTDEKGESKIVAVGMRQKRDLSKENVRPVMKKMSVNLDIQIKTMRLKDKTAAAGTANDLAGSAIAFFTKDVPGFVAGTAAETIYRMNLGSSKTVAFPVKDWIVCSGGWMGTITATKKEHRKTPIATEGNLREAIKTEDTTLKAALKLNGERDRNGGFSNAYFADIRVDYEESHYARNFYEKFSTGCLGRIIHSSQTQIFERKSKADGSGRITVFISPHGDRGTLTFNTVRAVGEKTYSQTYKTGCPIYDQANTKSKKDDHPFIYEVTGFNLIIEVDPKNPDVLSGTKTVKDADGSETTYSWNLAYCR